MPLNSYMYDQLHNFEPEDKSNVNNKNVGLYKLIIVRKSRAEWCEPKQKKVFKINTVNLISLFSIF